MKSFYRFRSIERILGTDDKLGELERDEIFFPELEKLNDPMEGVTNIYWEGDEIIWENLIRNYLLSFMNTADQYFLTSPETKIEKSNISTISLTPDWMPTEIYRKRYENFVKLIFEREEIRELPNVFKRAGKVRKEELVMRLSGIHRFVMRVLLEENFQNKLTDYNPSITDKDKAELISSHTNQIDELLNNEDSSISKNAAFEILYENYHQISLISKYNAWVKNTKNFLKAEKHVQIALLFPIDYVERLTEEVYSKTYVASFSAVNDNASIWGHYADGHKGIGLEFGFNQNSDNLSMKFLNLSPSYGAGGKKYHPGDAYLEKVTYGETFPEINFFERICRLSAPQLGKYWLTLGDKKSSMMSVYHDNTDEWRKKLWSDFEKKSNFKYKDWSYEEEYRLIISPSMDYEIPKEERSKIYDFNHLTGIIFGVKTQESDKLKIMKIIEEKCKKYQRNDFNFYQADFPVHGNKMVIRKLSLM